MTVRRMGMRWPLVVSVVSVSGLPAAAGASEWRYSATIYGWLTSLSAELGTPLGTVEVDQSLSDILDQLDFAAFGSFEARQGPWGLIADLAHADLSQTTAPLPGAPFGGVRVDTRVTAISGYAAYRLVETGTAGLDIAGGLRWYDLSVRANFNSAGAPPLGIDRSDSWVDPVIGARAVWEFGEGWRGAVSLDAGGFGIGSASDLSWQAAAELEYALGDRWSMLFGYRHLSIDRPANGRTRTLEISGPVIGMRARF